jgi:hypothetical protein
MNAWPLDESMPEAGAQSALAASEKLEAATRKT